MKTRTITTTQTVEKIIYIAFDGAEFDKEKDCKMYEFQSVLRNLQDISENITWYKELKDEPYPGRFTRDEYEDYCYRSLGRCFYYMSPLNMDGVEELNNLLELYPRKIIDIRLTKESIGKVYCLEFQDEGSYSKGYYDMEKMLLADAKEFYEEIGHKVVVYPKALEKHLRR